MAWVLDQKVMANHEGVYRNAQIEKIEEFVTADSIGSEIPRVEKRYYVHWFDLDRRLDRWVLAQELAPATQGPRQAKTASNVKGTGMVTRHMMKSGVQQRAPSPDKPEPKGNASIMAARRRTTADSPFFYLPKNIHLLYMGRWKVPTWYFSPYMLARSGVRKGLEDCVEMQSVNTSKPLEIRGSPIPFGKSASFENATEGGAAAGSWANQALHLCPFCCRPFISDADCAKHVAERCIRHPPGREVYRDYRTGVVMFEVDGLEERLFCQNLGLLSKLFLEHKALDFDMSAFVFYVLCVMRPEAPLTGSPAAAGVADPANHPTTAEGCEVAAYWSKEKRPPNNYNLSCILSLPQYQGRGYGRFLVEMSYEMSRREGKAGTPEKPLSDLGERLYHAFWQDAVVDVIVHHKLHGAAAKLPPLSIDKITEETGICSQDILTTLKQLNLMGKKSDVHITEAAAQVHELKRLERVASRKLRFEPHRLVWNPQQYRLIPPLPGVDLGPAVILPPANSGSSSSAGGTSGVLQASPPPVVHFNMSRAIKASNKEPASPSSKRGKRNR